MYVENKTVDKEGLEGEYLWKVRYRTMKNGEECAQFPILVLPVKDPRFQDPAAEGLFLSFTTLLHQFEPACTTCKMK